MDVICFLLSLFSVALFAWIILGYVVHFGRLTWGHPVRKLYDALANLFNPILMPIRRVLPPLRSGALALDLSPLVLIFGVIILRNILCR